MSGTIKPSDTAYGLLDWRLRNVADGEPPSPEVPAQRRESCPLDGHQAYSADNCTACAVDGRVGKADQPPAGVDGNVLLRGARYLRGEKSRSWREANGVPS